MLRGATLTLHGAGLELRGARDAAGGRGASEASAGHSISWSGQCEYLEHAIQKLKPVILVIILVLLNLTFRRFTDALLIMATLPFALAGGFYLM